MLIKISVDLISSGQAFLSLSLKTPLYVMFTTKVNAKISVPLHMH